MKRLIFAFGSLLLIGLTANGRSSVDTAACPHGDQYLIPECYITTNWSTWQYILLTCKIAKIKNADMTTYELFVRDDEIRIKNSSTYKIIGIAAAVRPCRYLGLTAYFAIKDADGNELAKAPAPAFVDTTEFVEVFFDDTVTVSTDFSIVFKQPSLENLQDNAEAFEDSIDQYFNSAKGIANFVMAETAAPKLVGKKSCTKVKSQTYKYLKIDDGKWWSSDTATIHETGDGRIIFPIIAEEDSIPIEDTISQDSSYLSSVVEQFSVVYPNPTREEVNVRSSFKISEIEIVNSLGQKVGFRSVNNYNAVIDVKDYDKGTYFLHIKTNRGIAKKKIVIQ